MEGKDAYKVAENVSLGSFAGEDESDEANSLEGYKMYNHVVISAETLGRPHGEISGEENNSLNEVCESYVSDPGTSNAVDAFAQCSTMFPDNSWTY